MTNSAGLCTRRWSKNRCWAWIVVGGILPLSLAASAYLTPIIGSSQIDVGLDFRTAPDDAPVIFHTDDAGNLKRLASATRISPEFCPSDLFFDITATGRKNPKAKRSEVWLLRYPLRHDLRQEPPASWTLEGEHLIAREQFPTTLRWSATYACHIPPLKLLLHPWSGIATVRTHAGEKSLDLYARHGRDVTLPVPQGKPLARYHASIPRRALSGLRIVFPHGSKPDIHRIYVGTLVPTIFFDGQQVLPLAWGNVLERWLPNPDTNAIALPNLSPWEHGGARTFVAVLVVSLVLFGIVLTGVALGIRLVRALLTQVALSRPLRPLRISRFLAFFIPLLLVWLFFLFAFFPAVMNSDACDQWHMAQTMKIYDYHPAFHTLTMRLLTLVWNSPAVVAITQILLMSAVIAYGFTLLLRVGIPWPIVAIAFLTVLVSPRNAFMCCNLHKDVFYAIVVFALTVALVRLYYNTPAGKIICYWVLLGVLLAFTPLYRHNGMVVTAGMLPLIPLFFWRSRRYAICAIVTCLLCLAGVQKGLFPAFDVIKDDKASASLIWVSQTTHMIASLVDQDVPLSDREYSFLDQVRSLDDRWAYSRIGAGGTVRHASFNVEFAGQNAPTYRSIVFSLLSRYPLVCARHIAQNRSYLYWPLEPGRDRIGLLTLDIWPENLDGLVMRPILPKARERLCKFFFRSSEKKTNWLLWRPGLHLWLVLLAAGVASWRLRDCRILIVFLPVLLNTISLLIAATTQHQRYQLPLTLSAAFLVCLAFLPRPGSRRDSLGTTGC